MSYKEEQREAKQALKKTTMLWEGYDKDGVGRTLDLGIKKFKQDKKHAKGSIIREYKKEAWEF